MALMTHPLPNGTIVQILCQNNTIINGTIQESSESNGTGNGWYYDIDSPSWGDGNTVASVYLEEVHQSLVICPDDGVKD